MKYIENMAPIKRIYKIKNEHKKQKLKCLHQLSVLITQFKVLFFSFSLSLLFLLLIFFHSFLKKFSFFLLLSLLQPSYFISFLFFEYSNFIYFTFYLSRSSILWFLLSLIFISLAFTIFPSFLYTSFNFFLWILYPSS